MKKLIISASLMVPLMGFGQTIVGSAHDFQAQGWGTTEICKPCHTPHNAVTGLEAPLWNHTLTGAAYTMYTNTTSSTLDATTVGAPDGISKLCLSCHDGTVALDAFGGAVGTTFMTLAANGNAYLGTDLSNDHPISFNYDAALFGLDAGLKNPTTALSGLGGTITADMTFGATNKMQCASCHDVHNGTAGTTFLLRKSNAGSALCLTCHAK